MTTAKISAVFWLLVATVATAVFLASNFAGPSGTPTYFRPTINVLGISAAIYVVSLILSRRRKKS